MATPIERLNMIIGKTILHYKILGDQLDLTFTDGTKVYDLLNQTHWVKIKTELNEKGATNH